MLLSFRRVRVLQGIVALACLALGVGTALVIRAAVVEGAPDLVALACVLVAAVLLTFNATVRLPNSYVAVTTDRLRIRLGGIADVSFDRTDVDRVEIASHCWWAGLGLRTNLRNSVAFVSATGEVADIHLRRPVRVWVVPYLIPARVRTLRVSVDDPHRLIGLFPGERSQPPVPAAKMPERA
jgi:hypothetical protein